MRKADLGNEFESEQVYLGKNTTTIFSAVQKKKLLITLNLAIFIDIKVNLLVNKQGKIIKRERLHESE